MECKKSENLKRCNCTAGCDRRVCAATAWLSFFRTGAAARLLLPAGGGEDMGPVVQEFRQSMGAVSPRSTFKRSTFNEGRHRMAEAAKHFEELTVFQEARTLVQSVYAATREYAQFSKDYALIGQVSPCGCFDHG